jgi:predicted nucleic acid-binding protein
MNNFMAKWPKKDKRYILLDTNIISRIDILGTQLIEIIKELIGYGYGIAISEITIFELFNEVSVKKEVQIMNTLQGLVRFQVRKNTLVAAAHLASMYKDHKLPMDQFETGDRIIAATAVLGNCIIFTLNGRDFPQPFFKEIERRRFEYQSKEWPVCVYSYFMEPQNEYIGQYHQKRIEPVTKEQIPQKIEDANQ